MEVIEQDVIIIGAGVSGIAAGYHLQKRCPDKSYTLLEARAAIGGTWDLFRYPGIRSDSDMSTFGFAFRPWSKGKVFANGDDIRGYVTDTAALYGIDQHIRFGHKLLSADWDSAEARWTLTVSCDGGETRLFKARFVFMGAGYYRYDQGYLPDFEDMDEFEGKIIHPQKWQADEAYDGKKIVVIGSGATAITLVPAMADRAESVTMLQRSPTYIAPLPSIDSIYTFLRRILPLSWAFKLSRLKNILYQIFMFQVAKRRPDLVRKNVRQKAREILGPDFDLDTHFSPTYDPWDQRFCVAPDGDFFDALKSGKGHVVTDHIDRFTKTGIRTKSGEDLKADIIIPATGLSLQLFGGAKITIDGQPYDAPSEYSYRGMMFSGLPNLVNLFGYTNASWTLKVDLSCERACRMLRYMDLEGYEYCVPVPPDDLQDMPLLNLNSGYIERASSILPKQGDRAPWQIHQNYLLDVMSIRYGALDDGALQFRHKSTVATSEVVDKAA